MSGALHQGGESNESNECHRTVMGMTVHNSRLAERWPMNDGRRLNTIAPFRKVGFLSSASSALKLFWTTHIQPDGTLPIKSPNNICKLRLVPRASGDRTIRIATQHQLNICGELMNGFEVLKNQCLEFSKPWLSHPKVICAALHESTEGLASDEAGSFHRTWKEESRGDAMSTSTVFIFEIKLEHGPLHFILPDGRNIVEYNVCHGAGVQYHAMMFRGTYDSAVKKVIFQIVDSPPSPSALSDRDVRIIVVRRGR